MQGSMNRGLISDSTCPSRKIEAIIYGDESVGRGDIRLEYGVVYGSSTYEGY